MVKEKICKFIFPISDACIHKEVGAKLAEWSGLKQGNFPIPYNALRRHKNQ